ncbi:MAG: type IV pilus twitching motility protein PilT [Bacillota bacterium]|nr:type IV pilus twitching motility protein PilT [Bacillota bacterium]
MNIESLLIKSIKHGASDLHITVGMPPIMRIDGELAQLNLQAIDQILSENLARQILSPEKYKKFETEGEVDTPYVIPDKGLFRVNCYHQRGTVGIAIRILPEKIFTVEDLGLPKAVSHLARQKQGLVLVTGPTGSGKTTTLAAMIDLINTERELHIVTLEDPIEYYHHHKKSIVTQREIGKDSTSFAGALRASLRQDPDVILIGEMRDLESISIALTAAETGHLVLATLHTIDAAKTVERVIDVFPSNQQHQIRAQLANSLAGIISQRLVRRFSTGGRVAVVEALICTHAVRNMIREGKIHQIPSVIETSYKYGMQTFDKHLQILYDKGTISREECLNNARDHEMMKRYLEINNQKIFQQ